MSVKLIIHPEDSLLFVGDSITDSGGWGYRTDAYGQGYVRQVAKYYANEYPSMHIQVVNRGVAGNRLQDVARRWQRDCLALRANVVTVLVGINDIWTAHRQGRSLSQTAFKTFQNTYSRLILELRNNQSQGQIALMAPFALEYPPDRKTWQGEIKQMETIIQNIAQESQAVYIPLNDYLHHLGQGESYQAYTGNDGVHPTQLGHRAIARRWLSYTTMAE